MLEAAVVAMRGPQLQVPTMYSALKYQGQPLYKYARQGITVPRDARPIEIFRFELLAFDGQDARFIVHCSKGTYIRTLIDDLGETLGCGAYVTALRRVQVGPFDASQMRPTEALIPLNDAADFAALDALLLPMDYALQNLSRVDLTAAELARLRHGQTVLVHDGLATQIGQTPTDAIRLYGPEQQFAGIASLLHQEGCATELKVRRLLSTKDLTSAN